MRQYHGHKAPSVQGAPRGASRVAVLSDLLVVNVMLAAAVGALFIGYLALNNVAAARGFEIRATENRISDLEDQRSRLDLQVVELQAMDAIESQVGALGLVPVTRVDYMGIGPAAVAVK